MGKIRALQHFKSMLGEKLNYFLKEFDENLAAPVYARNALIKALIFSVAKDTGTLNSSWLTGEGICLKMANNTIVYNNTRVKVVIFFNLTTNCIKTVNVGNSNFILDPFSYNIFVLNSSVINVYDENNTYITHIPLTKKYKHIKLLRTGMFVYRYVDDFYWNGQHIEGELYDNHGRFIKHHREIEKSE